MTKLKNILFMLFTSLFINLKKYYKYYKQIHFINENLKGFKTWFFPFIGQGTFTTINDQLIDIPRQYWHTLSNVAKIIKYGGFPVWKNGELIIKINELDLVTSPVDLSSSASIKEIFFDNEYHLGEIDYSNKIVLDIGANIGDSSLIFAKAGAAKVFAFEPLPSLHKFLDRNIELNGYVKVIEPHYVGLGNKNQEIDIWLRGNGSAGTSAILHDSKIISYKPGYVKETLQIKDWTKYLKSNNISIVDIIKMDCELCEYELLKNDTLLTLLRPELIIIEYHSGPQNLVRVLQGSGYLVEHEQKFKKVGMIFAKKKILDDPYIPNP